MELLEVVRNRRSIRRFLSKPVSEKIVEEIISAAIWAPSWGNTQPFEAIVASGPKLEAFKKESKDAFLAGIKAEPDINMPEKWPEINDKRYKDVGRSVLGSLSIDRKDMEGRFKYYSHMFSMFQAPVFVLITVDKAISLEYAILDAGIFLQTFCLLAHDRGLGTCSMAASVYYPEILRKHFPVPNTKRILMGVALGWPNKDDPVNRFERKRAPLDEIVQWVS